MTIGKEDKVCRNITLSLAVFILALCLGTAGGCSDQEQRSRDSDYSPESNFLLVLHTSATLTGGEFYFVIDGKRKFTVLSYYTPDGDSPVFSGKASDDEFAVLLDNLRKTNLLALSQNSIKTKRLPDVLDYTVELHNGNSRKELLFLFENERFEPLVKSVRSIKEGGNKLEEDEALQAIRRIADLRTANSWTWLGCILMYRKTPKGYSLLHELIEDGKVNPGFRKYLPDTNKK